MKQIIRCRATIDIVIEVVYILFKSRPVEEPDNLIEKKTALNFNIFMFSKKKDTRFKKAGLNYKLNIKILK